MGNSLVRQAMVDEMGLVKHRMTAIRGYVYHDVNNKLSPAIDQLMKKGQPLEVFATDTSTVLPSVRSVSALLKASRLWLLDTPSKTLPTPCFTSSITPCHALLHWSGPPVGGQDSTG